MDEPLDEPPAKKQKTNRQALGTQFINASGVTDANGNAIIIKAPRARKQRKDAGTKRPRKSKVLSDKENEVASASNTTSSNNV